MKRLLTHPLAKVILGWLFVFSVWLVLPVDPPYVDQAANSSK